MPVRCWPTDRRRAHNAKRRICRPDSIGSIEDLRIARAGIAGLGGQRVLAGGQRHRGAGQQHAAGPAEEQAARRDRGGHQKEG
jgi:hypothetical protein